MKNILRLYKSNPVFSLIAMSIGFFLWAVTLVFIIVIMAVAFTS